MDHDEFAGWRAAVGFRSDHHWTDDYKLSRDEYVRSLWEDIHNPDAPPLTRPQVSARLAALHQILADLEDLVARACVAEIRGPDKRVEGHGEWSFPVGSGLSVTHPLGELRMPRETCDDWGLHHRAYFAAPTAWPGSLIWSLLAFKPDVRVDPGWRKIQDAAILKADESADSYLTGMIGSVLQVQTQVPPRQ